MDDRMDEGYADESRSQEGDVEMPSTFSVVKEMEQAAVGLTEADREGKSYSNRSSTGVTLRVDYWLAREPR